MFTGAVPRPAIEQITRVVPFDEWGDVWVGCSGSFRFDQAVKERHPSVRVHSNDVSLLSCGLGALAVGDSFSIQFKDRLAFVENFIGAEFFDRVAAVVVALEMATYKSENPYSAAHFAHYEANFDRFLDGVREKLTKSMDALHIESFAAGDFREQAARAVETGGGVAAFPPTYKGGYERLYRFVDDNTDWPRPDYGIWDPKELETWILELRDGGVRHCIISDQRFEQIEPVTVYRTAARKSVYAYASTPRGSVRSTHNRAVPFRYTPVSAGALRRDSVVEIRPAKSEHMNFLKDRFLAHGIAHVPGMSNFMVFIDGRLLGGFIFSREKFPGDVGGIYLLSDFTIVRERRLSKLVAMLATSRDVIHVLETKLIQRIEVVSTTAFTTKPVSMKYRGIFDLANRKPGMLNYASKIREQSPQAIYREWFKRFAQNASRSGKAG